MGGGGSKKRTNEVPGTDQVISRPMRDLKKTAPDGANRQTDIHTDMATQLVTLTNQVLFFLANHPRYWNKIEASCPTLRGTVLHSRTTNRKDSVGEGDSNRRD